MTPSLREQVVNCVGRRDLAAAVALLDGADAGDDWECDFFRGWLSFIGGDGKAAVGHLQRALERNPGSADTLMFLGMALATQVGNQKALALKRDYAKQAIAAARRQGDLRDWANAVSCLEVLGAAAHDAGPLSDAEFAYRQLVELDPQNPHYLERLSHCIAETDLAGAAAALEAAVRLNPNSVQTQAELVDVRKALSRAAERKGRSRRARYPTTEQMRGDLRAVVSEFVLGAVPRERFITPKTMFLTMGSCFADEIVKKLAKRKFGTWYIPISEHINNTFSNRRLVDWAFGRCTGQVKERLDEMLGELGVTPAEMASIIARANVVVFTLGVAPAFFDQASGEYVMPKSSALNSRALAELYQFRTASVSENLDNLNAIYRQIRAVNPDCCFVVTVSPVPLRMTFEFESAIFADCLSKSTLRVVAHEFMQQGLPRTYYWPSFEVVRWLGGHVGPYYGLDDDSSAHVGEEVVGVITDLFIDHFS